MEVVSNQFSHQLIGFGFLELTSQCTYQYQDFSVFQDFKVEIQFKKPWLAWNILKDQRVQEPIP